MSFRLHLPFSLVAVLAVAQLPGCSNQGEGEVCDPSAGNAGSDDCQSGLICQQLVGVSGTRCCPPNLGLSKTAVCSVTHGGGGIGDASPAPPPDSGQNVSDASSDVTSAPADAAPDGPTDASRDSSADAGPDSPADASPDSSADSSADSSVDSSAEVGSPATDGSGG